MNSKKKEVTDKQFLQDLVEFMKQINKQGVECSQPLIKILQSLNNGAGLKMEDYLDMSKNNQDRLHRVYRWFSESNEQDTLLVQNHIDDLIEEIMICDQLNTRTLFGGQPEFSEAKKN